jgi:carboxypeptidase T
VWIVPLVNPDGLEYSIHFYRYWRKNRRDNGRGSFGVDLNRNYDFKWGLDDEGSSPISDAIDYRGPSPFSEPETQAIRDLVGGHNFKALVSYHSYSQVILYPWGHTYDPSPWDSLMEDLARNMSDRIQQTTGRVYEFGQAGSSLYLTNGDTVDWALGVHQVPGFTIELPPIDFEYGGFFNPEADITSIFQENLQAALYLIGWAVQQHPTATSEPIPRNLRGKQIQLKDGK